MQGIEERTTESGIHVLRLHYTSDPVKAVDGWAETTRKELGLSERAWRKEFEIDWTVASGLPVYAEDFVRSWHVNDKEILASPKTTIYRGWDMGPTHVSPACVWAQLDDLGRLLVLHELVVWTGRGDVKSMDIPAFCEWVTFESNDCFPDCDFDDWCDPAGWTPSQTDAKSAIDIMRGMGIHPKKGPMTFVDRKRAVFDRLTRSIAGAPSIIVSPTCTMLIEGFDGAYKYEEIGDTGRFKPTVDKNAWSHVMNGLEYLVGGLWHPRRKGRDEDEHRKKRGKPDKVTGY